MVCIQLKFRNHKFIYLDKDLDLDGSMIIPYSKWDESNYNIINWPENIEFCDYDKLKGQDKVKVLDNLVIIKFCYKNQ